MTIENLNNIDAFKNLSDEEKKLALEILKQVSEEGKSDILDNLKYNDFEEIPVDIDTFLDDKNYLGNDIWMKDEISGEEKCTLFPYWRNVLHKIFPDNLTTAYNTLILTGSIGLGKAQPLDASVLTKDGFKKMGELAITDKIYGNDGKLHNIIGIFPQGKKKVCKVTFNDHTSTECCDEHLWTVFNIDKNKEETLELKELINRGLYRKTTHKSHNYKIPVTSPIIFDSIDTFIDPYTLGVLIGDGTTHYYGAKFASNDEEIPAQVKATLQPGYEVRKLKDKFMYNICKIQNDTKYYPELGISKASPNKYKTELERLSLNTTALYKHIPQEYLYNSIENRIALLQGLMDTDGFISKDGAIIEYTTISEQLCKDFVWLVQSLGGVCHIRTKIPSYKNKLTGERIYCNKSYNIGIKLPKNICPFRLSRKINRLNAKALEPSRYITNIEYIEDKECQCIYIDSKEHLYLTNDFIVTHNTEVASIAMLYLLYRMLCLKDPYSYYGLMPNDKITFSLLNITLETAKGVGWSKIQNHIQNSPWFMDHGALNASRTAPTWQPNKNIELVFGSSNNQVVGRALFCLDGDTEILTTEGYYKIKELVDKNIKVISADENNNQVVSDFCMVKPTIKAATEYQIELEDGSIIKCTENHLFKLTTGEYKMAKDLTEQDEIAEATQDYFNFIDNIIKTRGQWPDNMYKNCERHHIIPKCLGGEPKQLNWKHLLNIIWLTPQEHFIAHKLLALNNPTNAKLILAFKRMCYSKYHGKIATADDYAIIKQYCGEAHSRCLTGKKYSEAERLKWKFSDERKQSYSIKFSGKNNPMYGKGYKLAGKNNGCYGHPVEPARLEKIKKARAKYIYTYNNIDYYGWYDLQTYLHSIGYNISQKGIESCIIGTPKTKVKYPELWLKITKRRKEDAV